MLDPSQDHVNEPNSHPRALEVVCAVVLLCLCGTISAARFDCDPSNYLSTLKKLKPGDELIFAPGTYADGLPLIGTAGTASRPIILRGPGDHSAVFMANDCCNTVQLKDASYLEIRNFTLDGSGTNGAFGVDSRGSSHHITLENLRIVNYGADQQDVGISTKGPAWNWVIRGNTIVGAGTGIYLGNSDGTAPFFNGLIEYNVVADTIGYNLQIKHQLPRPSDPRMPIDCRTIIRHNVWSKQRGYSTGVNARPNVLVGHFPLSGAGENDRYEIYGNFFYQNPSEALLQGEGNLVIHDNLFLNAAGDGIRVVPHHHKPRSVTIYNNTVVASGTGIWMHGGETGYLQQIKANAVFANPPILGPNQGGNVTGYYAIAADYLVAPIAPIGKLDLRPKPNRLSGHPVDQTEFSTFADGNRDFNGATRSGRTRGAYESDATNQTWRLALTNKPVVRPANEPDRQPQAISETESDL